MVFSAGYRKLNMMVLTKSNRLLIPIVLSVTILTFFLFTNKYPRSFLSAVKKPGSELLLPQDVEIPRPIKISSFKEIRDVFLQFNPSTCPQTEQWGGIFWESQFVVDGKIKTMKVRASNYTVCMAPGIAPPKGNCLVYSFGINFDWTFDEAAEYRGCDVYSFDPSMNMRPHKHSNKVNFYDKGLSDFDGVVKGDKAKKGWKMAKLSTLLRDMGHTDRVIDILKIDIEDSEHEVIPDIIKSGILENVRQLLWEIHNFADYSLEKYYSTYWLIEKYGFVKVLGEDWPHVTCVRKNASGEFETHCYVFTFYNKNFLEGNEK